MASRKTIHLRRPHQVVPMHDGETDGDIKSQENESSNNFLGHKSIFPKHSGNPQKQRRKYGKA